jgi:putative transposase
VGIPEGELDLSQTIAIDPGSKTFGKGITGDGRVVDLHDEEVARKLARLRKEAKRMQDHRLRCDGAGRAEEFKRRELQINAKIVRVRRQFHQTVINYLLRSYRFVLWPRFAVSTMVKRRDRVFGSKTTERLLDFGHYSFRQLLIQQGKLCPEVEVIVCDEPWTSKTCSHCGEIRADLGGSRVFSCRGCNMTIDRDVNGATNILVRYCTLWWQWYRPEERPTPGTPPILQQQPLEGMQVARPVSGLLRASHPPPATGWKVDACREPAEER